MTPDILLTRCIGALRLDGHAHDSIAVALAESAVDALAGAGYRDATMESALQLIGSAMRERAAELNALRAAMTQEEAGASQPATEGEFA